MLCGFLFHSIYPKLSSVATNPSKTPYDDCGLSVSCAALDKIIRSGAYSTPVAAVKDVRGCHEWTEGGDDVSAIIIPSKVFGIGTDGASTLAFLNALPPPFFGDYTVELVDGVCKDEKTGEPVSPAQACESNDDCATGTCGCASTGLGQGYSGASSLAAFSLATVLVVANAVAQL